MLRFIFSIAILGCCLSAGAGSQSNWNNSPNGQYHIQTDEGPERYFRYQTQSGQYRKEKRLQDGTVVGSYGWIDADGYLRLRDYIADNEGYRILKSKTVYVGQNRPIQEAIKSSKNVPPQSGILVKPGVTSPPQPVAIKVESTPIAPITAENAYLPPNQQVYISPNSIESSTTKPGFDFRPTVAPIAASAETERPYPSTSYTTTNDPISTYLPPTTPAPIYAVTSTPSPVVAITSNVLGEFRKKYYSGDSQTQQYYVSPSYDRVRDYSTNSLNLDPYSAENTPIDRVDNYENRYKSSRVPARYQNISPATYNGNYLGNGYDPQYPNYDGISVTNNGFRYYLPRQYHEEENSGGDTRAGSFGYIDPFGIRRVVYYNTSPGSGFQHRKNNRYVGFSATPYDPRPL